MTSLDKKLRPLAQNLIGRFGKSAVFTTPGKPVFDPVSGKTTPGTPTTDTVKVSPPGKFSVEEVDGTMIQQNDVKVSVAALDHTPDINQSVTFDGNKYNIIGVSPVYSGEQVAKYDLQLRK